MEEFFDSNHGLQGKTLKFSVQNDTICNISYLIDRS